MCNAPRHRIRREPLEQLRGTTPNVITQHALLDEVAVLLDEVDDARREADRLGDRCASLEGELADAHAELLDSDEAVLATAHRAQEANARASAEAEQARRYSHLLREVEAENDLLKGRLARWLPWASLGLDFADATGAVPATDPGDPFAGITTFARWVQQRRDDLAADLESARS